MFNITGTMRLVEESGNEWFSTDPEVTKAVRAYLKAKKAEDSAKALKAEAREILLAARPAENWKNGDKLRTPAGTAIITVTHPERIDSKKLRDEFPVVREKCLLTPKRTVSVRVNGA